MKQHKTIKFWENQIFDFTIQTISVFNNLTFTKNQVKTETKMHMILSAKLIMLPKSHLLCNCRKCYMLVCIYGGIPCEFKEKWYIVSDLSKYDNRLQIVSETCQHILDKFFKCVLIIHKVDYKFRSSRYQNDLTRNIYF